MSQTYHQLNFLKPCMKPISTALLALFLLVGCSENPSSTALENSSAETSADIDADKVFENDTESEQSRNASTDEAESDTAATDDAEGADEKESTDDIEGVNQTNVTLVVKDQITAGQVIVAKVATSRDGWISIHRSGEDGGIILPESIGEARVDSGDSENIVIDLWGCPLPR
ncbi:MAG: hypothetical protein HC800_08930 [Phormidesmis sp. RL_2_1]|nr:hypothetical protein [Phormidesmis sp. RL_2_1]